MMVWQPSWLPHTFRIRGLIPATSLNVLLDLKCSPYFHAGFLLVLLCPAV